MEFPELASLAEGGETYRRARRRLRLTERQLLAMRAMSRAPLKDAHDLAMRLGTVRYEWLRGSMVHVGLLTGFATMAFASWVRSDTPPPGFVGPLPLWLLPPIAGAATQLIRLRRARRRLEAEWEDARARGRARADADA